MPSVVLGIDAIPIKQGEFDNDNFGNFKQHQQSTGLAGHDATAQTGLKPDCNGASGW